MACSGYPGLHGGQFFQVLPSSCEVIFVKNNCDEYSGKFQIRNTLHTNQIVFKIKVTHANCLRVRPSTGCILPNCTVCITACAERGYSATALKKDRLLVMVLVDDGCIPITPEIWKRDDIDREEVKLKCLPTSLANRSVSFCGSNVQICKQPCQSQDQDDDDCYCENGIPIPKPNPCQPCQDGPTCQDMAESLLRCAEAACPGQGGSCQTQSKCGKPDPATILCNLENSMFRMEAVLFLILFMVVIIFLKSFWSSGCPPSNKGNNINWAALFDN